MKAERARRIYVRRSHVHTHQHIRTTTYHSWSLRGSTTLRELCLEVSTTNVEKIQGRYLQTNLERSVLSDGAVVLVVLRYQTASTEYPPSCSMERDVAARGDGGGGSRQSHFLARPAHRGTICDRDSEQLRIPHQSSSDGIGVLRIVRHRRQTFLPMGAHRRRGFG